jgi:Rha family phage regulatory protein
MANTLIPQAIQPALSVVDGTPMVNSVDVARHFGKLHKNVLRDIEKLNAACDPSFYQLNFEPIQIEVDLGKGRKRSDRAYNLTRDGFALLAMGFTGEKAIAFKVAYITAFNQLERAHLALLKETAEKALTHREFRNTLKMADRMKLREAAAALLDEVLEEPNDGRRAQKWMWLQDLNNDLGIETVPLARLMGQEGGAA